MTGRELAVDPASSPRNSIAPSASAPPAPPPAARSARGRARPRRNRGPIFSQKAIEAGSPPCSPQMPSLMSGRVARPRSAASLDQLADALDVEADERILRVDALARHRCVRKRAGVVAADAERGLGQVVGAEREELADLGDLARHQRGARQFDHRADEIFDASGPSRRTPPAAALSTTAFISSSSRRVATSGIITSGIGASPGFVGDVDTPPRRSRAPASRRFRDR